ncbi:MAG: phosphotransferase enzyme family protein [Chloroflexota bacterium]
MEHSLPTERELQQSIAGTASLPGCTIKRFLARGEYTFNYRATDGSGEEVVVRLVTGSQMGLSIPEQALYEVHALELLVDSGRTPLPIAVEPEPADFPYPIIIMSYLPGRPLDYSRDLAGAAECVAEIHNLGVPDAHRLQGHPDPFESIEEEAGGLLEPYVNWKGANPATIKGLEALRELIREIASHSGDLFERADRGIVNYDLNTHNFVVDDGRVSLLDWEKARIGPTSQDLAHFLLPTTTLWRDETATLLSPEQEDLFLDAYFSRRPELGPPLYKEELRAMKALISLRALSWCAWSLAMSASGERAIVNQETLDRGRTYLQPDFLKDLLTRLTAG